MSDDNAKAEGKKGKTGISTEDHFKFLIACIRHGVNGKINFEEVAKECSIVTKAAAAKRYERLMKAHNIQPQPSPNPRDSSAASTKGKNGTTKEANAAAAKKRKAVESDNAPNHENDEEESSSKKKVKAEPKSKAKKPAKSESKVEAKSESKVDDVKVEPEEDKEELPAASSMAQYDGACDMAPIKSEPATITTEKDDTTSEGFKIDDETMFDNFLQFYEQAAHLPTAVVGAKKSTLIAD
ncbi:MAG: hypothetical protein L6R40_005512 [Gallowayella cf. fulva]|nr:MAG: hypothetical protein L6R40_005512 [Xanthomendoza cf. fulva]